MAGFLLEVSATVRCPHGAQGVLRPGSSRVKVAGQPVLTVADTCRVVGCGFTLPTVPVPTPQPCTEVRWVASAARVRVEGRPVLLREGPGLALAGSTPQGQATVSGGQTRVRGT